MKIRQWEVWYKNLWIEEVLKEKHNSLMSRHWTENAAIKKARQENNDLKENHRGYYYVRKYGES